MPLMYSLNMPPEVMVYARWYHTFGNIAFGFTTVDAQPLPCVYPVAAVTVPP